MPSSPLKRQLGLAAVAAIVIGNMLGSGVFFTPGELAAVADRTWQVYFIWALSGLITLCGALTLAELSAGLPEAGASFHIIRAGCGPFWAFLTVWLELWVSGPGAIAGISIAFGEFMTRVLGPQGTVTPVGWGIGAIGFFALVNLAGVEWGGRTQIGLTILKVLGILALVVGALWLAAPATTPTLAATPPRAPIGFLQFVGLGIGVVLFTYDGWIDVSHVAGEVRRPERNLPLGLVLGVGGVTLIYLLVNVAFLRVVPLVAMRAAPTTLATAVATAGFGPRGASWLNVLMVISIFGALGGLVMTLPRLFYTLAAEYAGLARPPIRGFFGLLSQVSPRTATPTGAILFTALASIAALMFFGTFSRLVNFLVVPLQCANILMVGSIFRLRGRLPSTGYRIPGYPIPPIVFIVVMIGFLVSAVVFRPVETLIGIGLALTGVPVYRWIRQGAPSNPQSGDRGTPAS